MRAGVRLGLAGFLATGVAYGPARMGFGLFLPRLRDDLGLSSAAAGAISGGAFAAFLVAIPLAARLTRTRGPRTPVLLGMVCAAAGMVMVALSPTPALLAVGVVLAGASPGLCWSPFNDAVAADLPPGQRPTALSVISTGTTLGIALAAFTALLGTWVGLPWRWAWLAFAASAAVAALACLRLIRTPVGRRGIGSRAGEGATTAGAGPLLAGLRWPLVAAVSFGATSAVYLAFAADTVAAAGGVAGLPAAAAGTVVYLAFGIWGLLGLMSAQMARRWGLVGFLVAIFAASGISHALLAIWPGRLAAVLVSAGLQGVCVMTASAVVSFWTTDLRPQAASSAFTVVLSGLALGGVVAPVLAGLVLDELGRGTVFAALAGLSVLTGGVLCAARGPIRRAVEAGPEAGPKKTA